MLIPNDKQTGNVKLNKNVISICIKSLNASTEPQENRHLESLFFPVMCTFTDGVLRYSDYNLLYGNVSVCSSPLCIINRLSLCLLQSQDRTKFQDRQKKNNIKIFVSQSNYHTSLNASITDILALFILPRLTYKIHCMKSEFLCSLWQHKENFMPFMANCKWGFMFFVP